MNTNLDLEHVANTIWNKSQLAKVRKNQRVKKSTIGQTWFLNEIGQKMPFWLARFWWMKFIFLERGGKMWFVGKNPTKFGLMVHELWLFWSSKIGENELIISWQPHMGFESSWTFWKWENKIFNFHIGQKFIWSFYHDASWGSRSFHFWQLKLQVHFLFLENFLIGLIFFHDEVEHDRWGLYKHEWTSSDQFYPSNLD